MTAEGKRLFRSEVMARYAEKLASIRPSGERYPQGLSMAMNEARRWLDRELDRALPDPKPTESTGPILEEIDVLKLELAERDAMLGAVLTALADIDDATHMCLTSDNQTLKLLRDAMPVWYQAEEGGLSWEGVERWWLDHQTRVRKEQQAQERERRRQEILPTAHCRRA